MKSNKRKYVTVPILINHNFTSLPIGKFEVEERYVTKPFDLAIGYLVKDAQLDENGKESINEIELLEVSLILKEK